MKIERRYCKKCKKITEHVVERDEVGFERIFLGIVTVGFSEALNRYYFMCSNCEHKTSKFPG